MEGAGGGAGEVYAWAIENPDKVSCVYAENPRMHSALAKTQPLDNLAPLAKANVPLLHVCGSLDPWFKDNTLEVEKRYKKLGGKSRSSLRRAKDISARAAGSGAGCGLYHPGGGRVKTKRQSLRVSEGVVVRFVWALPLCCVLVSVSSAQIEPTDPSPASVFSATGDRLAADVSRQPRYTCAQNLTREFYVPSSSKEKGCIEVIAGREQHKHEPPLAFWDRLRLDVAIAGDREIHSWSGAPRFSDEEVGRLASNGPIGTGDFAGFVASIFMGKAKVRYTGKHSAQGRALYDYSYEVSAQDSHYQVVVDPKPVVIAYSGSLTLDAKTSDIVELVVHTPELPAQTDACQAQSQIEFRRQEIHGHDVLLPRETRLLWIDRFGGETLSTTSYLKCQEYSGHAVLRFGGAGSAPNAGSLVPGMSAAVASIPRRADFRLPHPDCDQFRQLLRGRSRRRNPSLADPRARRLHPCPAGGAGSWTCAVFRQVFPGP